MGEDVAASIAGKYPTLVIADLSLSCGRNPPRTTSPPGRCNQRETRGICNGMNSTSTAERWRVAPRPSQDAQLPSAGYHGVNGVMGRPMIARFVATELT